MGIEATACLHHLLEAGRHQDLLCQLSLPPLSVWPALQAASHLLPRLSQASEISAFLPLFYFFSPLCFSLQCSKLKKTRIIIIFFCTSRASTQMCAQPTPFQECGSTGCPPFQQQSHPSAQQWGGRAGCAVLCHCAIPVAWDITDLRSERCRTDSVLH